MKIINEEHTVKKSYEKLENLFESGESFIFIQRFKNEGVVLTRNSPEKYVSDKIHEDDSTDLVRDSSKDIPPTSVFSLGPGVFVINAAFTEDFGLTQQQLLNLMVEALENQGIEAYVDKDGRGNDLAFEGKKIAAGIVYNYHEAYEKEMSLALTFKVPESLKYIELPGEKFEGKESDSPEQRVGFVPCDLEKFGEDVLARLKNKINT